MLGNALLSQRLGQSFAQGISVRNGGRAPFKWTATGLPQGVSIRWATGTTNRNIPPGDAEIFGNPQRPETQAFMSCVQEESGQ